MTASQEQERPGYRDGLREAVVWRPPPALRGYIEECRGYRYAGSAPGTHRGLPSSAMTLVIAFEQPLDVGWFAEAGTRGSFWGLASGLHTGPAEIFHDGRQFGIQIGLTAAGARNLLGMPMATLAHDMVPIEDLIPTGPGDWYGDIASQPTWRLRFEALDALLLRLAASQADAEVARTRPELSWAWARLEATGGVEPVGDLARELGWSRRHLHHLFRAEFGVSPKQAARIVRFQRSIALLGQRHRLSDVAALSGFSDQAHLTREWRAMAGYSPREWARAELPFLQDSDLLDLRESSHV